MNKYFVAGILLILSSFGLLLHNYYEEYKAGQTSISVLNVIKNDLSDIEQSIVYSEKMETINIDGYDYIGTISIPVLDMELPIMDKFDYNRLKIAPCKYYGSIHTNDLIICGHSYKTHFRYLNKLKLNDKVIFTDINGVNYIYEVLEIEVLESTDVEKMINNDFDLTLYTCTNKGIDRLAIRCNRVLSEI